MKKTLVLLVGLMLCLGFALSAQAEEGSWTGFLADEACAKDYAKASSGEHAACAKGCVSRGGAWALAMEDASYVLEIDGETAEAHAGQQVMIQGTMNEETKVIKVSALEMVED